MILSLLVTLIVLLLCWWVITKIAETLGAPSQIFTIINVLFVAVAVLWVLQGLGLLSRAPLLLH